MSEPSRKFNVFFLSFFERFYGMLKVEKRFLIDVTTDSLYIFRDINILEKMSEINLQILKSIIFKQVIIKRITSVC